MFKDSICFSTFTPHLSKCSRINIMHFEVGCNKKEQQFVYSSTNFYQVCFEETLLSLFSCVTSVTVWVTWRNSYIFLAHFAIHWRHNFFISIFFSFFLLLQKKLPTSSPTTSTKSLCFDCCLRLVDESEKRLLNIWTRFLSWKKFSEQLNSSTGFSFPRSWMVSLPAISSDSVYRKPFLVYEIFTLHYSVRDIYVL